jgi:hypothetical protein
VPRLYYAEQERERHSQYIGKHSALAERAAPTSDKHSVPIETFAAGKKITQEYSGLALPFSLRFGIVKQVCLCAHSLRRLPHCSYLTIRNDDGSICIRRAQSIFNFQFSINLCTFANMTLEHDYFIILFISNVL